MSKVNSSLAGWLPATNVTLPEDVVEVPEWADKDNPKGAIRLRGFSSRERDSFEAANLARAQSKASNGKGRRGPIQADLDNFRARLIARSIVNSEGHRIPAQLLTAAEEKLGDEPATVIDPLFSVCQNLHGMSDRDVEALTANFEQTADSDSNSASH